MKLKTVKVPRGYDGLHIELDGAVVNIYTDLKNNEGRRVQRVNIDADGDRYKGDPQWWCPDLQDPKGIGVRIVQMPKEELPGLVYQFYDPHPGVAGAIDPLPEPLRIAANVYADGYTHHLAHVLKGMRIAAGEIKGGLPIKISVHWTEPGSEGFVAAEEDDSKPIHVGRTSGWRVLRFRLPEVIS